MTQDKRDEREVIRDQEISEMRKEIEQLKTESFKQEPKMTLDRETIENMMRNPEMLKFIQKEIEKSIGKVKT